MGKINIIIQREFNERVRKRTFILTTLLTPLLLVGIMVAPTILMHMKAGSTKNIIVSDASGIIASQLKSDEMIKFEVSDKPAEAIIEDNKEGVIEDLFGILVIGSDIIENSRNVQLYTYQASTIELESSLARQIENIIEDEKLKDYDIENLAQILDEVSTSVSVKAYRIDESGQSRESSSVLAMVLAFVFGLLIYFFVFLYGGMVMQGVIEEKSSKVLEIMVSSVKPFQMMMGKIIGIACVALLQFAIWMVLIFVLGTVAMQMFAGDIMAQAGAMDPGMMAPGMGMDDIDPEMLAALSNVTDFWFLFKMLGGFLVYFIGGYLLYAAMYAAVGSAVDNVSDSQQLQLPITIPMILAFLIMINVTRDPHSSLAVWFSMIPFTSPIIMVARLPYGVPVWEFVLSVVLLYATFLLFVWLAGKIYRVGIFMYGKKPTFGELIKWAKYKS